LKIIFCTSFRYVRVRRHIFVVFDSSLESQVSYMIEMYFMINRLFGLLKCSKIHHGILNPVCWELLPGLLISILTSCIIPMLKHGSAFMVLPISIGSPPLCLRLQGH